VWLVSLESERDNILSPDEEERAARFRFETDRRRWNRARSALRTILADCTGIPAAEVRFVLGKHGKPSLEQNAGIEFSLSHSGEWAIVAVTRGVPVGIDIERIREGVDMAALLGRLGETDLPETKDGLFRAWTRREAMTKALGGALMEIPSGDFRIGDLEAPPGYAATLVLIGQNPRILYRQPIVLNVSTV
jgi:4'-phosphopantetheinyl transferase